MVQLGLVNGLTDARRWMDQRPSMDGPTRVNGLNSTLPSRQGALVAWRWANSVDRKRQGGRKGAAFLPLFRRFSAAFLPLVKSGGFAAEMRHFCGSFATRQFQLCGIFQRIHGIFATFRLFDDGIAHVQGHFFTTNHKIMTSLSRQMVSKLSHFFKSRYHCYQIYKILRHLEELTHRGTIPSLDGPVDVDDRLRAEQDRADEVVRISVSRLLAKYKKVSL